MRGAIAPKSRSSFFLTPFIVIPGRALREPGIHGPAPQPPKRLKGGAMDAGSAVPAIRHDGGSGFQVKFHHAGEYKAVPKVGDIYSPNAGLRAKYPPRVEFFKPISPYEGADFEPYFLTQLRSPRRKSGSS